jgi:hypothetical protein
MGAGHRDEAADRRPEPFHDIDALEPHNLLSRGYHLVMERKKGAVGVVALGETSLDGIGGLQWPC